MRNLVLRQYIYLKKHLYLEFFFWKCSVLQSWSSKHISLLLDWMPTLFPFPTFISVHNRFRLLMSNYEFKPMINRELMNWKSGLCNQLKYFVLSEYSSGSFSNIVNFVLFINFWRNFINMARNYWMDQAANSKKLGSLKVDHASIIFAVIFCNAHNASMIYSLLNIFTVSSYTSRVLRTRLVISA